MRVGYSWWFSFWGSSLGLSSRICLFVGWWFYLAGFTGFFFICTDWSWLGLKFNQVQVLLLFLEFQPIIWFQLNQFLHKSSIFVILIDCICSLCYRSVGIFAYVSTYNFPCFQENSSCASPQVSLFCRFHRILFKLGDFVDSSHILFPSSNMVWVLFIAFGTCVLSSTGFPMVSTFLAFEAPHGSWNILFDSLYTLDYLPLLGNVGLVECQDVGVGFYFFLLSYSFYLCDPLVSQGCWHLLFYC